MRHRKALSVAEAKSTLSDAIREVEAGNSLVITRHGKPVAALVRAEDLAALERLRSAGPASWPATAGEAGLRLLAIPFRHRRHFRATASQAST
jgi:prevent-host-death family protein